MLYGVISMSIISISTLSCHAALALYSRNQKREATKALRNIQTLRLKMDK